MGWYHNEETVEAAAFLMGDQALLPVISQYSQSWKIPQFTKINKPNSESEK